MRSPHCASRISAAKPCSSTPARMRASTYSRLCRSSTMVSMPLRCSSCDSSSPEGPPPMMQTWVFMTVSNGVVRARILRRGGHRRNGRMRQALVHFEHAQRIDPQLRPVRRDGQPAGSDAHRDHRRTLGAARLGAGAAPPRAAAPAAAAAQRQRHRAPGRPGAAAGGDVAGQRAAGRGACLCLRARHAGLGGDAGRRPGRAAAAALGRRAPGAGCRRGVPPPTRRWPR